MTLIKSDNIHVVRILAAVLSVEDLRLEDICVPCDEPLEGFDTWTVIGATDEEVTLWRAFIACARDPAHPTRVFPFTGHETKKLRFGAEDIPRHFYVHQRRLVD